VVAVRLAEAPRDEQAGAWVRHEYDVLRALDDPRIPVAHGYYSSQVAVALTHVDGLSLRQIFELRQDGELQLDIATTLHIATELAQCLRHAHGAAGPDGPIVHAQLDPDSVMLRRDGQVVLTGFGTAPRPRPPGYTPPEAAAGAFLDARTDQWCLGALLVEMVLGLPLYTGTNAPARAAIECRVEPWVARIEQRHPAVARVVARLLSPAAGARYPREMELVSDLLALSREAPGRADPLALISRARAALESRARKAREAALAEEQAAEEARREREAAEAARKVQEETARREAERARRLAAQAREAEEAAREAERKAQEAEAESRRQEAERVERERREAAAKRRAEAEAARAKREQAAREAEEARAAQAAAARRARERSRAEAAVADAENDVDRTVLDDLPPTGEGPQIHSEDPSLDLPPPSSSPAISVAEVTDDDPSLGLGNLSGLSSGPALPRFDPVEDPAALPGEGGPGFGPLPVQIEEDDDQEVTEIIGLAPGASDEKTEVDARPPAERVAAARPRAAPPPAWFPTEYAAMAAVLVLSLSALVYLYWRFA
jgi:hypothetical protein